jgi:CDGSH-type Zn-finger protein
VTPRVPPVHAGQWGTVQKDPRAPHHSQARGGPLQGGQPEEFDASPVDGSGATITPYRDGPLIVRGSFRLTDQDGVEIDPGRDTIALCRCGKSGIKPFCDGSHKRSGFSAPSAPSRPRPAAQLRSTGRGGDA